MLKSDRFPKKYLEDIGEIYTFVIVKLSHQSKTIVTMKGTIKEMIYCRARLGAMLRRREVRSLRFPRKTAVRSLTYCYN